MKFPSDRSPIAPLHLSRRHFSQMLAATAAFAFSKGTFAQTKRGPTMLLGATDPFCGLDTLRMRYAAGHRPSDDIAVMQASSLPAAGSRGWPTYASWSLAFDWLYECPAFDQALKDRVAKQLLDGATTMAATPDIKHPEQASFHNYTTRFLGLTTFALCAAAKHLPHDPGVEQLRSKAARAFQNILQVSD